MGIQVSFMGRSFSTHIFLNILPKSVCLDQKYVFMRALGVAWPWLVYSRPTTTVCPLALLANASQSKELGQACR